MVLLLVSFKNNIQIKVKNIVVYFKIKKWQILTIISVIVLFIFNPSLKDFKEFVGDSKDYTEGHNLKRSFNFIVLSIYDNQLIDSNGSDIDSETKYIGILNN